MPKQIERDQEIYLAPEILGKYENGEPIAIDERNDNERLNPRNVDDKIKIYQREVEEWFLNPASELIQQESFKNAFIVLMISMSYIEGVEQYKTGRSSDGKSIAFFIKSFNRLYPNKFQKEHIKKLYAKARCGLFHNGMVKGGVIFNNAYEQPITFEDNGERIKINPCLLLQDIQHDFQKYITELTNRNNTSTRENFDRMFIVL